MIQIPAEFFAQIQENGEEHYPEEGAGLLLGKVHGEIRIVEQVLPLENRFQPGARHNRYMIEPQDMLLAEEKADELGLEIIGVFHSHPDHPARPSEYDRQRALPWYSYIITKVTDRLAIESRSWRLTDERIFNEEQLQIK
ncbi:MAG: M67 family metallopeptidase [Chloroflexi bacterium]|nr:M67 family metallopeptidase [Chloroflexota bacterium]